MIWKRIQKEGTETNPRFKCMEEYNQEYDDDILKFREDVINALDQFYDGQCYVGPGTYDKSIVVTNPDTGVAFRLDISASDEVEM